MFVRWRTYIIMGVAMPTDLADPKTMPSKCGTVCGTVNPFQQRTDADSCGYR
jgi:hypothetical protein